MTRIWKTSDFDYELPPELIAQQPLAMRSASRLLCVDSHRDIVTHRNFIDFIDQVNANDLLIFNDTKVIPARLLGHKETGGQVECLVERILSKHRVMAHLRASKAPAINSKLNFFQAFTALVINREDDLFELEFQSEHSALELLHQYGHIPLPLYIKRSVQQDDLQRYQTVYAKKEGAVAAPTAGLHFDSDLLQALTNKGVDQVYVTLHVGAGTFQPVRTESLTEHQMHHEYMEVSSAVCEAVERCRQRRGRVIAVGTTVVRCLETAARNGELKPYQGETNLFIYPGYQFHCVDAMVTNFHWPKSSLLMLVCAFGGYALMMRAYQEAINQRYRFFSYGDAMFITQVK
jgi:S-adenosylmethionine:tRNA ribosyltransferase-isomerase